MNYLEELLRALNNRENPDLPEVQDEGAPPVNGLPRLIPREASEPDALPAVHADSRADRFTQDYTASSPRDWSMSIDGQGTSGRYSDMQMQGRGRDQYKQHMRNIFMPPPDMPELPPGFGMPKNTLGGYAQGWRGEYDDLRRGEMHDYNRRRINSMVDVGIPPEQYAGGLPKPAQSPRQLGPL